MTRRHLPPVASVATQGEGAKLVAPAASRNVDALCTLLAQVAPAEGRALELASGTGQHMAAFAARFPDLQWQPTEVDPARRASINAYTIDSPNTLPAAGLNATEAGWHKDFQNLDLIVLINLLHLISWPEAQTLLFEVAQALAPRGRFVLYGPFMRHGKLISDGDARFHAALSQQDPEIGYKDDGQVQRYIEEIGLTPIRVSQMPANNLAFIAEKPDI